MIEPRILIITSTYDMTADYIINKFKKNAIFYRFNADLYDDYEISVKNNSCWQIESKHWILKEEELTAIYYRKPSLPNLSNYEAIYHGMMQREMITLLKGLVDSFEGICLSRPSVLSNAENKILQLRIAKKVGFKSPMSLITNSDRYASIFCTEQESIIKPISIGKIYHGDYASIIQTNIVDMAHSIEGLGLSPAYFQQFIPKDYELRVTVIDGKFYSVRIDSSQKIDWRKKDSNNKYSLFELSIKMKEQCLDMLKFLGLKYGAFDFIVRNDDYYFLEVNPNGQWYWLEEELSLDISNSIFNYLVGE